jgi:hypothetical protein
MKLLSLMIVSIVVAFFQPKPTSYTDALRSFDGAEYQDVNCSALICKAHNRISEAKVHCMARQLWEGCEGNLTKVTEAESLWKLDWSKPRAGDVLAVNGVHVIAYLGHGQCMDSDPLQGGVREVSVSELMGKKHDAWYSGPVRVERWVR